MINIAGTNVTLMVKDMDASIRFYENISLTVQNRWENHYAMIGTTGITIGIHPAGDRIDLNSGSVSIGFMLDKINEGKELLDTNSVTYKIDEGKSGTYLHFKDPDGTVLYLVESKW